MKGSTMVPLLFTSITAERSQVDWDNPLYAFRYKDSVVPKGLLMFIGHAFGDENPAVTQIFYKLPRRKIRDLKNDS